jgi:hypothetical protein
MEEYDVSHGRYKLPALISWQIFRVATSREGVELPSAHAADGSCSESVPKESFVCHIVHVYAEFLEKRAKKHIFAETVVGDI